MKIEGTEKHRDEKWRNTEKKNSKKRKGIIKTAKRE